MTVTPRQVELVLKGNHSFTQFGFAMMIGRMKNVYARDSSEENLQKVTDEVNKFLEKFADIMASDFEVIQGL